MADVVLCIFKSGKFFAAHSNLTNYSNITFPLPQQEFWTECILPRKLVSRVISCLQGELLHMKSLQKLPMIKRNIGNIGTNIPPPAKLIHSSTKSTTLNKLSSSLGTLHGPRQACRVKELKLKFQLLQMCYCPSPRPSNWMENTVPSAKTRQGNTA
jgi:hypothetical protein